MKNANTLRTQEAIARFGKAARHPLCAAWLKFREWQSEHSKHEEGAAESLRLIKGAEQQKKAARALYEQFYKEGKQREVIKAHELLCSLNEHLEKLTKCRQAQVKLCGYAKDWRDEYNILFVLERQRAERTRDTKALEALKYLKKTVTKPTSDGQKRVLGILEMLLDKTVKATWAKNGAAAGYWQVVRGADRPLSDEFWQGRFTVMEFRSGLEAMYGPGVAGDKKGKEVWRTLKGLGIQPAEDQVGRKWKPPAAAGQKTKQPVGRPRKVVRVNVADIDAVWAAQVAVIKGKAKASSPKWEWRPTEECKRKQAAIDRELGRLRRAQRERLETKRRAA